LARFKVIIVEILAVRTQFSTVASSKEVSQNNCDVGGHPKINMAVKTGNTYYAISITGKCDKYNVASIFQGQIQGFDYRELDKVCPNNVTMNDSATA